MYVGRYGGEKGLYIHREGLYVHREGLYGDCMYIGKKIIWVCKQ